MYEKIGNDKWCNANYNTRKQSTPKMTKKIFATVAISAILLFAVIVAYPQQSSIGPNITETFSQIKTSEPNHEADNSSQETHLTKDDESSDKINWSSLDWSSLDWSSLDWNEIDWSSAKNSEYDLSQVDWNDVIKEIEFQDSDFSEIDWTEIDMSEVKKTIDQEVINKGIDPNSVDWDLVDLSQVDLSDIDLSQVDLSDIDLSQVDLSDIDWTEDENNYNEIEENILPMAEAGFLDKVKNAFKEVVKKVVKKVIQKVVTKAFEFVGGAIGGLIAGPPGIVVGRQIGAAVGDRVGEKAGDKLEEKLVKKEKKQPVKEAQKFKEIKIKLSRGGIFDHKIIRISWNIESKSVPDEGDPLVFSLTDKPVNVIRNWPEQHESLLTEFDLYDTGKNVTLSRTPEEGTMTLFLDLNDDGKLSDGTEWLFDQHKNVYEILSLPPIDSNQNGWFDYSDDLWSVAMVKDGDRHHYASELGIVGFNWSNHVKAHGDMHGENRQYSDCLYMSIYYYPNCIAVSEKHFAIAAYNQNSILLSNGKVLDSFGSVMGHLDMSENSIQQKVP